MKKILAIAACSLPFALASTAYSQGPSGRSGSGSPGVEAQTESTNPSGLAGSTGIKPDKTGDTNSTSPSPAGTSTSPGPATNDKGNAEAANRSASGDSTRHSSQPMPAASGDAAKPTKTQTPDTPPSQPNNKR